MTDEFHIPALEPKKRNIKKIITVVVIIFVIFVLAGAFVLRYFRRLNIPQDININNYSEYLYAHTSFSVTYIRYPIDPSHNLVFEIRNKNSKRLIKGSISVKLYEDNNRWQEYTVYFHISPQQTEEYLLIENLGIFISSYSYHFEVVSVEGTAVYNG